MVKVKNLENKAWLKKMWVFFQLIYVELELFFRLLLVHIFSKVYVIWKLLLDSISNIHLVYSRS